MPVKRLPANPLITPADVTPTRPDLEILCAFNPGAVRFGRETLLLVRVGEMPHQEPGYAGYVVYDPDSGDVRIGRIRHGDPDLVLGDNRGFLYRGRPVLTSLSHIRVARSTDGVHFKVDPKPALFPSTPYETYGCEDARVTYLDGRYYVNYSAVSPRGISTWLAVTDDFRQFEKIGMIFCPSNKDICIFPEKVRGAYVCRHRPDAAPFGSPSMWTAWSPDLVCWGRHELTLAPVPGTWEGGRLGCGAPPVRTREGWLEIYHAADEQGRYCLGSMLSDLERPERILARSSRPVLEPEAPYERAGLYGNCVFCCGVVTDPKGGMTIYYGAADSICAGATTTVEEMIAAAKE